MSYTRQQTANHKLPFRMRAAIVRPYALFPLKSLFLLPSTIIMALQGRWSLPTSTHRPSQQHDAAREDAFQYRPDHRCRCYKADKDDREESQQNSRPDPKSDDLQHPFSPSRHSRRHGPVDTEQPVKRQRPGKRVAGAVLLNVDMKSVDRTGRASRAVHRALAFAEVAYGEQANFGAAAVAEPGAADAKDVVAGLAELDGALAAGADLVVGAADEACEGDVFEVRL